MQNSGQTTVVLFGNALDPRGRTNHPQPASPRPHGKPVAPVLAKNQPVWRSRPSKTLVTGRTLGTGVDGCEGYLMWLCLYVGIRWALGSHSALLHHLRLAATCDVTFRDRSLLQGVGFAIGSDRVPTESTSTAR